jgi:hypothetical protein
VLACATLCLLGVLMLLRNQRAVDAEGGLKQVSGHVVLVNLLTYCVW